MSYRAFKRLLGETSLERKCRWLLGAGVLLLMTASFWAYARQTEDLAYGQLETTGRVLLSPILVRHHAKGDQLQAGLAFEPKNEATWPAIIQTYTYQFLNRDDNVSGGHKPTSDDLPVMHRIKNEQKNEETRQAPKENAFYYYAAIRAGKDCLACHRDPTKVANPMPDLN